MQTAAAHPQRHPWLDAFRDAPDAMLSDLLAGYAAVAPYERATPPDAARMIFGISDEHRDERNLLDEALGRWLDARRTEDAESADMAETDYWLRQVLHGLRMASLLRLRKTAVKLRLEHAAWKAWTDRLAIPDAPDVRAAYLTTLAQTQRLAAESSPRVVKLGLQPLWISICEHAGGPLPATYLGIGLLGLRQLPSREGQPSDRAWMTGLANWAAMRRPPLPVFQQEWWNLKAQYVRTRPLWGQAIDDALRQQTARHMPAALQEFWRNDVGADKTPVATPKAIPRHAVRLPPAGHVDVVLERAGEPFKEIHLEIDRVIAERKRFAEATGDSHFLVRSACNIGMRLLEAASEGEAVVRGQQVERLAREALAWQPDDAIPWSLWRDGLEAQGKLETAELVGWDAIRRFPEDPQRRTQLAKLMTKQPARRSEAERLFRDTVDRFPGNIAALNQLAQFLAHTPSGFEEAASLLEGIKDRPRELMTRLQLQELVGQPYAEIEGVYPSLDAELGKDRDAALETVLAGGRLRRLASQIQWYGADHLQDEIKAATKSDPNAPYALYLKDELGSGRDQVGESSPGVAEFGVAFIHALQRKDAEKLAKLETEFPDPAQLFDVARVFLFGDVEAAARSAARLSQMPVGETRQTMALRGFLLMRLGLPPNAARTIDPDDIVALAANDNIAQDLREVAFTPWDTSLAA